MQHKTSAKLIYFIFILSTNKLYSQNIDKYIFLHPNSKNDNQINVSPISSGYNKSKSLGFNYKQVPTKSMLRKIDSIDLDNSLTEETNLINNIEKKDCDDFYYGEQSPLLTELEEEAQKTIYLQQLEQKNNSQKKTEENIASYAANLKIKKGQKDKHKIIENATQTQNDNKQQEQVTESSDIIQSVEISTDKNGKLTVTKESKIITEASDSKKPEKTNQTNSSTSINSAKIKE